MNNSLFFSFVVAAYFFLIELIRRYTLKKNLIDTPNERSSHSVSTPRGGGPSIIVIFLISISFVDSLPTDIFMVLIGSGSVIAIIGFWDDHDRANGEIFIATDGTPHSSRDIYNAMCSVLDKSIPKWSVPKNLFDMASLINPRIKYKLNKLLGDECYSSAKLEALGFKAQKTLKDMNETSF
jgi:nucleoside-diphosphate-sugar epimerase